MTGISADLALDALLAELRPPPMSLGLADRVVAAALALPRGASASRPIPRHSGRGRWLRRPLLVGGAALGLAFASAVAASLAGVELPRPVAAMLEKLPLIGKAAPEPPSVPAPPRRTSARPTPPAELPKQISAEPVPPPPVLPPRLERRIERLERAREIVEARRAAGLPTPRADRMEARRERVREIVAARRAAGLPTPRADRIEARSEQVRQLLDARRQQRAADQPTPQTGGAAPPPTPMPSSQRSDAPAAASAEPAPAVSPQTADRQSLAAQRERLRRQQLVRPERLELLRRVQQRREVLRRMQERRVTMDRARPR